MEKENKERIKRESFLAYDVFGEKEEYRKAIKVKVREKYSAEIKRCRFLKRIFLEYRIYKEIQKEFEKRYPPKALY